MKFNKDQVARALKRCGGMYEIEDIVEGVALGNMQCFREDESFAVTQINVFPRKRVLTILLVAGERKHLDALHEQVLRFARSVGAEAIRTYGRFGWKDYGKSHGYRPVMVAWQRDL